MPKQNPPGSAESKPGSIRRFFQTLGPGLVTGAADDDPSGIATYSMAGAQFGTAMLWTAAITWPLMAAVQFMCARIGLSSGLGLAGALRKKFPVPLLSCVALSLLAANAINIGADLSGMAEAAAMLAGLHPVFWVIFFGAGITVATIRFRYHEIANVLKWLTLSLFTYVIAAFVAGPDWRHLVRATFLPAWPHGHGAWAMLVAILGTTISPYLFFWQTSQEVEEEKALGRRIRVRREGATGDEIATRRLDVGVGTFFSNLVMYFIMLTAALTLHRHGRFHIETSTQAAEALRPIAGKFAATLYTVGLVGAGLIVIPTLSGSAAYAFAETFRWRQGLDEKFHRALPFYGLFILSILIGVGLAFAKVNPEKALFWTAVINGLLAPFLMVAFFWWRSTARS